MKKKWLITILFTISFLGAYLKSPVKVNAQSPDHFDFTFNTGSNKIAGQPFQITITAKDSGNATLASFNNQVNLTDTTGTISPNQTGNFQSGIWTGDVYIIQSGTGIQITATYSSISSTSSSFTVNADSRIKFLSIVSGNNQVGTVGSTLPIALTTKVSDPYGNPLSGIGVTYSVSTYPPGATNQSLSTLSGTSDSSGLVSSTLTLGRKVGTYTVSANLGSGMTNAVVFYENANASSLKTISIAPPIAVIPLGGLMQFTATGYDLYQNPIAITPTWSVQNGGGNIDSTGIFRANTSSGVYLNTVRAVSGSIGSTASVTVVGSGSGSGSETATSSATPSPSPSPSQLPAGVLNDVFVDPAVITALKDAQIAITADAVDQLGNSISTGVNFTFEVTGNLGTITQTGENTVLLTAAENGIGTVTVKAQQGNIVKIAKVVGSVGTGLNRRLVIEPVDSPQRVDEPFTISIAAKDSLNNFITDYTGPIVIADTTGTIDPEIIQPNEEGIWYVQAVVRASNPEVTITVAGDGMVGVSNIFEVQGEPSQEELMGAGSGKGIGEVLGASISAKLKELFQAKDPNKFTIARYLGAGIAGGIGILGASIGGGLMAGKGLEAIGRNPFAKGRLKANLYLGILAFIGAAGLAVYAVFLIIR